MRPAILLLLLAAPLAAQDETARALDRFGKARAGFEKEGAREKLLSALHELEDLGDPRAIEPITAALAQSIGMERRLLEAAQEEQRRGADAQDRLVGLQGELELLRQRKAAGASGVDRQIHERLIEAEKLEATRRRTQQEWERLQRRSRQVAAVRDALADACGRLLAKAGDTDAGRGAIATIREYLDASEPRHALYLVRVLRTGGLRAGAPCLIGMLEDEEMDAGVARNAISALARLGTKAGALALVALWEREPEAFGAAVRHALSLAARRNLADLAQAKSWAESLEG